MHRLAALVVLSLFASAPEAQEKSEKKYPPIGLPAELVRYVPLPGGGKHPRLVRDEEQGLHIVFLRETPGAGEGRGDLYYTFTSDEGESFRDPVRVNSTSGSVALGYGVNGARIAYGGGTVHVVWTEEAKGPAGGWAVQYARLAKGSDAFAAAQSLGPAGMSCGTGVSVVANETGLVYLVYSAAPPPPEGERPAYRVYGRRSTDGGETFSEPEAIDDEGNGVSGESALDAEIDRRGWVLVVYRIEIYKEKRRDLRILHSSDEGRSFETKMLTPIVRPHDQESGMEVRNTSVGKQVLVAWDDGGRAFWTNLVGRNLQSVVPNKPYVRKGMVHRSPSITSNRSIAVLMTWAEKPRGGSNDELTVAWQAWDIAGKRQPIGRGKMKTPSGSTPVPFDRMDGGFGILY